MNIIKNNQVIFILFLVIGFSYQFDTEKIVTVISLFIIILLILFKNIQHSNNEVSFYFINNIGKIPKILISLLLNNKWRGFMAKLSAIQKLIVYKYNNTIII